MAFKEISGKADNLSRFFNDVGIGFKANPFTKDVAVLKNENAIKQSLMNLVQTSPGEKLFRPEIGSGVRELLFEPMAPMVADAIQDDIINTVGQFEPRIELLEVDVNDLPGDNAFNVTINYRIVGVPLVETVAFVLQRPE